MKKTLLMSALIVAATTNAHAAPKVYGKIFLTADYVNMQSDLTTKLAPNESVKTLDGYDENAVEINSHGSRIGIKGEEALSDHTNVIYKLEYGVKVDGDDHTLKSRDTYLGLANTKFGEVRVGRNSSVLDEVNNVTVTEGYWDNLGEGKLKDEQELRALNMLDDSRQSNSIVWFAPQYKDVPVKLALQYASNEDESRDEGYGASMMFEGAQGITAGLAYTKNMDNEGKINILDLSDINKPDSEKVEYSGDIIRGTLRADMNKFTSLPLTLGVMYQEADYKYQGSKTEKGLVVSGKMKLDQFDKPAAVYLQYNKTDNLNGYADSNSDQIVLGGTYDFKKDITAHAYIGKNSADYVAVGKVKVDEKGKKNYYANIESDIDVFAFGAGLEYKF
ncbi:porin [Psychrobacter ciconiae]|uniref:porin n=1 Tax=Psychrobacter ciconiae TaxID=1553449 RepID=UPI00191A1A2B|nr:porin [Psychrobacter ciconiae]